MVKKQRKQPFLPFACQGYHTAHARKVICQTWPSSSSPIRTTLPGSAAWRTNHVARTVARARLVASSLRDGTVTMSHWAPRSNRRMTESNGFVPDLIPRSLNISLSIAFHHSRTMLVTGRHGQFAGREDRQEASRTGCRSRYRRCIMWPMWSLVPGEDSSTGNVTGGRKLARYVLVVRRRTGPYRSRRAIRRINRRICNSTSWRFSTLRTHNPLIANSSLRSSCCSFVRL